MRIIAGTLRGRKLLSPKDDQTTRPITDRVKQSLFDRLWSMGALPEDPSEPAGCVWDIFCGTGSLGLEALSRGAETCLFVEQDRDALERLQRNIDNLDLAEQARVLRTNALATHWLTQAAGGRPDLVFLDPPYALVTEPSDWARVEALMREIAAVANERAVLVLRTPREFAGVAVAGWRGPMSHEVGSMTVHVYELEVEEGGDAEGEGDADTGAPE
jgi:16S rRNA (guanine966-N2)-methyltransferase